MTRQIQSEKKQKGRNAMIRKYRFGCPIETDSVVLNLQESPRETLFLQGDGHSFRYMLAPDEIVYGLGEQVRGINKRGWIYRSHTKDEPFHEETTQSLYAAHNFLLLAGERNVGLYLDTPEFITWDIGYTRFDAMEITLDKGNVDIYVIEGSTPDDIVQQFRQLIGRSYIPPKWAFGYGQCRWSYQSADEVREVVRRHREAGTPLDMLYLDIDYMDGYADFTINTRDFPDFENFVEEMRREHIHLIPIIDAGIRVDPDNALYAHAHENGYFVKDDTGEDVVVGVWPGDCCFPDFLNDDARQWFGDQYRFLTEKGIDGFWNDMNEPAVFYLRREKDKLLRLIESLEKVDDAVYAWFEGEQKRLMDRYEIMLDVFVHRYRGKNYKHRDVHNLFGYFMTRSAGEAFERLEPDKRILLFSRSSFIGMHRYGGVWQGDNNSWWDHLRMGFRMMPSLNMCGFLYTGSDCGGFGRDTTEDLLLRWLSVSLFMPLMRNHSALGTRRQEIYRFSNEALSRGVIRLRYRLLPYLYSEYMKAAVRNTMMFRPLGFAYPDDRIARETEDQLMLGEELMIAPVMEQNRSGRSVYLPERMRVLHFTGDELRSVEDLEPGLHYMEMPLGDNCLFLREGKKFPLAPAGAEYTVNVPVNELELFSFGADPAAYELYDDDGNCKDYGEHHIHLL